MIGGRVGFDSGNLYVAAFEGGVVGVEEGEKVGKRERRSTDIVANFTGAGGGGHDTP